MKYPSKRDSAALREKSNHHSVAIVGGSGFVGSSLAKHLSNLFEVTILDRKTPQDFGGRFETCDVRDRLSLTRILQGYDLVINTAIIQIPEINTNKRLGYEVNVLGIQNLCEAVESIDSIKGLLHTSSWHVFGETSLRGVIDEEFGFHPDKIEQRARLYAFSKIVQESIIRITGEMSSKSYGIVRLGTVLGEGMPVQTAANIFIDKALEGEPMTPFRDTQHRPMLYVDIQDVCEAFESFASRILRGQLPPQQSRVNIVNLMSPPPVTIVELAQIVQAKVTEFSRGEIAPKITTIDRGVEPLYSPGDRELFTVDTSRARHLLGLGRLVDTQTTIERLIRSRMHD